MIPVAPLVRVLDPAERYFWMLDHVCSANFAAIAELERRVDPADLAASVAAVQRCQPLLRARIGVVDGQPGFVETDASIPLTVTSVEDTGWVSEVEGQLESPFEATDQPLARCLYFPLEGTERSVLALILHHSIADALAGVRALQQIVRHLEEGVTALPSPSPSPSPPSAPPPLHERFPPELLSPRGALEVVREVQAERKDQVAATTFPFHDRAAEVRETQIDCLVLGPTAADAFRSHARLAGATVTGALAAAVLESGVALFDTAADRTVFLATPTDLRQRVEPPLSADVVMLATGLLCTPYVVSGSTNPGLARAISEQTRREMARNESHLFYRLARAGSFAATDEGMEAFAKWFARTPENLGVSNLGVVDHRGDPAWLRSLSALLGPSPNQLAFVAATTYRDRLVVHATTDRAKLSPGVAERLVGGIAERIGARRVRGAGLSSASGRPRVRSQRRPLGDAR